MRLTDPDHIVAFQGLEGSHSDVACRTFLPYARARSCASSEDVLEAVVTGHATLGLLPVENSIAGRVADNPRLIAQSDLTIAGEYYHPVEHCLLGLRGGDPAVARTVTSHPQALAQCRRFIARHALVPVPFADTASAAQLVQRSADPSMVAIGSALAATLYDLEVRVKGIQDEPDNFTHFMLVARDHAEREALADQLLLTSATFSTRNIAAGLYKALGGFATNGVNLLKIESSMPTAAGQASAHFFVTFEGSTNDRAVQMALEELSFFSTRLRVLGSYPAHASRARIGPRGGA